MRKFSLVVFAEKMNLNLMLTKHIATESGCTKTCFAKHLVAVHSQVFPGKLVLSFMACEFFGCGFHLDANCQMMVVTDEQA